MSAQVPTIEDNGNDKFYFYAPYSKEFVDRLKEMIDSDYRSWDPDAKAWIIDSDFEDDVAELAREIFGEVQFA